MTDHGGKQCSICERPFTEFGNSAYPFTGRCCNDCDNRWVTPARIFRIEPDNAVIPILRAFARYGSRFTEAGEMAREMMREMNP